MAQEEEYEVLMDYSDGDDTMAERKVAGGEDRKKRQSRGADGKLEKKQSAQVHASKPKKVPLGSATKEIKDAQQSAERGAHYLERARKAVRKSRKMERQEAGKKRRQERSRERQQRKKTKVDLLGLVKPLKKN